MADDIVSLSGDGLKFGRSPANGELLIGNGSGFNLSTLTAGSNVTITNSSGGISISATSSGGTVTSVTGTAPITSTGGATPNIALTTPVAVQYGGTGLATITSGSLVTGNGTGAVSLVAPGASGNLLTSNGTTWASAAPTSTWTLVKKTADQTVSSSTTLVNDNQLTFPVSANTIYAFNIFLSVSSAGGGGFYVAVNGPASPNKLRISATNLSGFNASAVTAYNTTIVGYSGAYSWCILFTGMISVGATSGDVVLRIAQNISNASATTFEKGSYLEWAQVG